MVSDSVFATLAAPGVPVGLGFSACGWLQIQETWSALKNDVAAFGLARCVADLGQESAEIVKGKIRIVLASHELAEHLFCSEPRGKLAYA